MAEISASSPILHAGPGAPKKPVVPIVPPPTPPGQLPPGSAGLLQGSQRTSLPAAPAAPAASTQPVTPPPPATLSQAMAATEATAATRPAIPATPKQTQRVVGPDGIVRDVPVGTLQAAQGSAAVPPATPGAASLAGASPSAAKMVGTPAQTQSALTQAMEAARLNPQGTLEQATRTASARPAAVNSAGTAANTLQGLSGLGAATQAAATKSIQAGLAGAAPAAARATLSAAGQALPADKQLSLSNLTKLPVGGAEWESELAAVADYYHEDPTQVLSYLNMSQDQAAAAGAAIRAAGAVTFNDIASSLGYDTPDKISGLASTLGVSSATLQGMTPSQIAAAVRNASSGQYGGVAQTAALAASGGTSQAEREALATTRTQQEQSGQAATEAAVRSLATATAHGDTVTVGGREYSVDDLLKSGTGTLVRQYLDADAAGRATLEKDPTFAAVAGFVHRNEETLSDANDQLKAAGQQLEDLQTKNQHVVTALGGATNADSIMSALLPDWGHVTTDDYESLLRKKYPGFSTLLDDSLDPAVRQNITTALSTLAANSPGDAAKLASLSPEKLRALGVTTNDGRFAQYTTALTQQGKIGKLDPHASDYYDQLGHILFPDAPSGSAALSGVAAQKALGNTGPTITALSAVLDANHDGRLDSPEDIAKREASYGFKDFLGGTQPPKSILPDPRAGSGSSLDLAARYGSILQDGVLTLNEVRGTPIATGDIYAMLNQAGPGMSKETHQALSDKLDQQRVTGTQQLYNDILAPAIGGAAAMPWVNAAALGPDALNRMKGGLPAGLLDGMKAARDAIRAHIAANPTTTDPQTGNDILARLEVAMKNIQGWQGGPINPKTGQPVLTPDTVVGRTLGTDPGDVVTDLGSQLDLGGIPGG